MVMDPIRNPYSPGAGSQPPELAGRAELREMIRIALERIRAGRPAKSVLMVGLRGAGKTVLLLKGYSPFPGMVRYKETKSDVSIFTPENIARLLKKADASVRP
jgi:predicted AAA+ superfamily ATPase